MKAFWEWMKEQGYSDCVGLILNESGKGSIRATKQSLIGYMVEYIMAKGYKEGDLFITIGFTPDKYKHELYYDLEKKIDGLDK